VPGLKNKATDAYLVDGHAKLATTNDDKGMTVLVPMTAPDKIASVIALKINGPLEIENQ
jgi:hypothetical protein